MIFVLENIRSAWNVGSIMRTADALGADVLLVGYTPRPIGHNLKLISKTSIGAENYITWAGFDTSTEVFEKYSQSVHFGIEIAESSQNIFEFIDSYKVNNQKISSEVLLWFGNEIRGLDNQTLLKVKKILHLPMKGQKESLNVATTVCASGYLLLQILN
jgi:23S rRNA (guanosine2251-2'-O)-methyltransferase